VEIRNLQSLINKLKSRAKDAEESSKVVVAVGFNAAYAIWVHENMEMWPPGMRLAGIPRPTKGYYWDPQGRGQPKFLETPARYLRAELAKIVLDYMKAGVPLPKAMFIAGLRLQREAQQLVPVDTGNLKASAFTVLESGG
jgi:hypothetical protein